MAYSKIRFTLNMYVMKTVVLDERSGKKYDLCFHFEHLSVEPQSVASRFLLLCEQRLTRIDDML